MAWVGRFARTENIVGSSRWKLAYEAFDRARGMRVAYCIINPAGAKHEMDRIMKAIETIRRVDHQYIVKIFDWRADRSRGEIHLVAELFAAGNIRSFLSACGSVEPRVFRKWGRDLLMAIAYLHSLDLPSLVLNVKAKNVLVHADLGAVKLDLLSVSSLVSENSRKEPIEEAKLAAPELLMGHKGQSMDVYGWAMVLMEGVTGCRPYDECTTYAKLFDKLAKFDPPELLEKVEPRSLREVLRRLFVRPSDRPTAYELLEERTFAIDPEMHGLRFLVLDDDNVNRMVCCRILANEGLESMDAVECSQAVQLLGTRPFDVLLTDIIMPVDGFESTRLIRKLGFSDIYIIGITAHATDELKNRYRDAGMDAYIIKPFTFVQVREALRSAFMGRAEDLRRGLNRSLSTEDRTVSGSMELCVQPTPERDQ
jgi:CheY-like chemotaxis protein